MTTSTSRVPLRLMDWLRPQLRWVTLPSWLLSVLLHVGLAFLILFLSQLPSCQRDISGDQGESFLEVGIHVRAAPPSEFDAEEDSRTDAQDRPARDMVNPLDVPEVTLDRPPVDLQLPKLDAPTPVIGAGHLPHAGEAAATDLVRPATSPADFGQGSGGTISGGASFLGIQDGGKRFVYVIDRSFSMENDNAMQAAKMELLASLARLNEAQQFQIIFYNHEFVILQTRGGRFDMFWGTDAQRLQVSEQLRTIQPSGGTRHFPALMKALDFQPDAIFFLTDGDEADLRARERELLKQKNRHGARIHCIEFGKGSRPALDNAGNFLKKLAAEHDGQYTYRDVRTFR